MEQKKSKKNGPIVWLFHEGGNSSSALQYTLKQVGYDCTTVTTEKDFTVSLEKVKDIKESRPALVITDNQLIAKKATKASVPVIIQEVNPSVDYKNFLPKVYEIVPKPEQNTQPSIGM